MVQTEKPYLAYKKKPSCVSSKYLFNFKFFSSFSSVLDSIPDVADALMNSFDMKMMAIQWKFFFNLAQKHIKHIHARFDVSKSLNSLIDQVISRMDQIINKVSVFSISLLVFILVSEHMKQFLTCTSEKRRDYLHYKRKKWTRSKMFFAEKSLKRIFVIKCNSP